MDIEGKYNEILNCYTFVFTTTTDHGSLFLCIELEQVEPASNILSTTLSRTFNNTAISKLSGRRIFINECAPYDSASAKSFGIMDIAEMVW